MDHELEAALARELGARVRGARALGGGSINAAWHVELVGRAPVFVKTHPDPPPDMFAVEARGLAFLREGLRGCDELRVPQTLVATSRMLVLELLDPGPRCHDFDARLGRGLARLHRSGAALDAFGLDHDNYIGSLPQANAAGEDWPSFYRDRRLMPMIERAGGLLDRRVRRRFDALFTDLDELCGAPEAPARLHGDLWAGNLHRDRDGQPVILDPAVYVGHREIDLAMMRLFGGFGPRCFAAYAEAHPLAPGWERRVHLYQLYPLLVHVVLFGGGYVGGVEAALDRLV